MNSRVSPFPRGVLNMLGKRGPQIYLASREDIFHVKRLLAELPIHEGRTFVGIIGGLGTLNFIAALAPRKIILLDINKDQVDYAACVLELIRMSASREEFVERFFSRRYATDGATFLKQEGDRALFDRTLRSMQNQEAFQKYFAMIRDARFVGDGLQISGNDFCRSLKLTGPPRGTPPGDNSLYFGEGWLRDAETFARLRSVLRQAEVRLVHSSIDELDVDGHGDFLYFHGSNVRDASAKPYIRFLSRTHEKLSRLNENITFVHFGTYHAVNITEFKKFDPVGHDVHTDCAAKVAGYTRDKDVLEIVSGSHYFGQELKARSHEVKTLKGIRVNRRYDVAVSHILHGSKSCRWGRRAFANVLDRLLTIAPELVIVEHNSESLDFNGRHMLNVGSIVEIVSKYHGVEMKVEFSKGIKDDWRNIVIGLRVKERR